MSRQTKSLRTTADAASFLGVSIATVTRLARAGVLDVELQMPGPRGARLFHVDELSRVAAERNLAS